MKIINNLTNDDMLRSLKVPTTASLLSSAHLCLVEACDAFTSDTVNPVLQSIGNLTPRETVLMALFYRMQGFCKTATVLKAVAHQQSLTSAERSMLELYIDMELLHRHAFSASSILRNHTSRCSAPSA